MPHVQCSIVFMVMLYDKVKFTVSGIQQKRHTTRQENTTLKENKIQSIDNTVDRISWKAQ